MDYYEVLYTKNGVIYRMIYFHKDRVNTNDVSDSKEYAYNTDIDGISVKLEVYDKKLLSNLIKLNDEYYMRMTIYTPGNTKAVQYADVNFDGVHLFK